MIKSGKIHMPPDPEFVDRPAKVPVNPEFERRVSIVKDALIAGADQEELRRQHGSVVLKSAIERMITSESRSR